MTAKTSIVPCTYNRHFKAPDKLRQKESQRDSSESGVTQGREDDVKQAPSSRIEGTHCCIFSSSFTRDRCRRRWQPRLALPLKLRRRLRRSR